MFSFQNCCADTVAAEDEWQSDGVLDSDEDEAALHALLRHVLDN